MHFLKLGRTSIALLLATTLSHGETIHHSGGVYTPYSGTDTSLTLSVEGDTEGKIIATDDATLTNWGANAITIDYIDGTTLWHISTVGSKGSIAGNVEMTVRNGTFNKQTKSPAITEAVLGTAHGKSDAIIDGDVNVTIESGSFHGNIFGGGGATVTGDISLTIHGGTFNSQYGVFGGNSWGGVTEGSTSLKITGGDFTASDIFGGNYRTGSDFDRPVIKGDSTLIIEGGKFNNISGGSYDAKPNDVTSKAGQTEGNTSILIDTHNSSIEITGDINAASGIVDGNSAVTFTGSGENLAFTGNVRAHSSVDGSTGRLNGEASIQFTAFTGEFAGAISEGFDTLSISSDSVLSFTESFNVHTLLIAEGAEATLQDGTTFQKLSLSFGRSFSEGEEFTFDLNSTFLASGDLVHALLAAGSSLTIVDGDTQEWSTTLDVNTNTITVVEAIPEPSTLLLLAGGVALFALHTLRRRERAIRHAA